MMRRFSRFLFDLAMGILVAGAAALVFTAVVLPSMPLWHALGIAAASIDEYPVRNPMLTE